MARSWWTCRRSCPRGRGCSRPGRAVRPTRPTRTPSPSSARGWQGCARSCQTRSSRCCSCSSTVAARIGDEHTRKISQLHRISAGTAAWWREEVPLRSTSAGSAGHRPPTRRRRQDPQAGGDGAGGRPRADLCPEEGRGQGAEGARRRDRHLAARVARCRPVGCGAAARRGRGPRPVSRTATTSPPGPAPPRSTRRPAITSATGSLAAGTARSTGCCTSWPPSSCAPRPKAAPTSTGKGRR